MTAISLEKGDITRVAVDAIVNAANSSLMGGGGVDGAIHRAGGPSILAECVKIVESRGRLPAGQAVITGGGLLKAKFVVHTVGPVWRGGNNGEAATLASAYAGSLAAAKAAGVKSIAFPSISTGAYGYPVEAAAETAVGAVRAYAAAHPDDFEEIRFVLFDNSTLAAYRRVLDGAGKNA